MLLLEYFLVGSLARLYAYWHLPAAVCLLQILEKLPVPMNRHATQFVILTIPERTWNS